MDYHRRQLTSDALKIEPNITFVIVTLLWVFWANFYFLLNFEFLSFEWARGTDNMNTQI